MTDIDQRDGQGKSCTKCGEWKLLSEYHNRAGGKDGKRNDCKECVTARVRQLRIDKPEQVRASDKKSKTKHADKKKERDRKYNEEHREQISENNKKWKKQNPEKVKINHKRYKEKHAEAITEKNKEYNNRPEVRKAQRERQRKDRLENPDRYKDANRKSREKNREKINARNLVYMRDRYASDPVYRAKTLEYSKYRGKIWRQERKDLTRIHTIARRARLRNADGTHTAQDIREINEAQNFKCVYCETPTNIEFHVDHKDPLSRGGSNWPSNLQILCAHCNVSKWARTHEEFLEYRARMTPANDNETATEGITDTKR